MIGKSRVRVRSVRGEGLERGVVAKSTYSVCFGVVDLKDWVDLGIYHTQSVFVLLGSGFGDDEM